jgi:polysaccharide biosynthesis PFTS motif protein
MNHEKLAFFEEINSAFYPIVKKYLNKGFTIYLFDIDDKFKGAKRIKEPLDKKIVNLSEMEVEYTQHLLSLVYAHKNVDYIFDKYFSHTHSIKLMEKLLKFPEIVNMYKKKLLTNLQKLYKIQLRINEIAKNKDSAEIYFFPHNHFKIHLDKSSLLMKNINVIPSINLGIILSHTLCKIKKIRSLSVLPYMFFKKTQKISNNKIRKEFKVGIRINHPKNIFSVNYLNANILISGNELPKRDVLFIDEVGQVNLKDYEKRGYNYTSLLNDREIISTNLFWRKIVKCFLPVWVKSIFLSFFEESLIIDTNYKILCDYINWNIFTDSYKINNYVAATLSDNISKTYILSQSNIKTWLIYFDNSTSYYYTDLDETTRISDLFSFMYYDYAVVYGDNIRRFFQNHRNIIKKYIMTGVLYSQIVHELQEGKLKSPLHLIMEQKKEMTDNKKIITVFDTTYGHQAPLKIKDGIRFGNDILKLLDEFSEIGIIFKAKKELALTPYLTSVYDKLKNHERCIFVARYDKEGISAPEVIVPADLVISAAFTSTTAEALGAKKKAIYYDPSGYYVEGKYYFNRFPNFVAHDYEELKKLIPYWLYEVTDEEFDDFLNTYVKHEIDPYLDGKALTRLRKLLMESN